MKLVLSLILLCWLVSQVALEQSYICKRLENEPELTLYCHVKLGALELRFPEIVQNVKIFKFNDTVGYHHLLPIGTKFQNLPQLKELHVSHVRMPQIPKYYFSYLRKLERLVLTQNEINDFFYDSWSGLTNLKTLDLSHNNIGSDKLADGVFRELSNLQVLDLSNNEMEFIEAIIFRNLTNLQVLNLSQNHLSTFNESSIKTKLDQLHDLQISQNRLKQLDSALFDKVPNLKVLNASHNELTTIGSNDFKNLTQIRYLDLNTNRLEKLDDGAFESLKLASLDLSGNPLTTISLNAFKDAEIEILKLSNSKFDIEQLTVALQQAAVIRTLDLSNLGFKDDTPLSALIAAKNHSLIKLNMSHNEFTKLPQLPQLSKISEIDFSFNQIRVLNPLESASSAIAYQVDTKQTYLYLQGNPFTCLPCNMVSLIQLAKSLNETKCVQDASYCLACYDPDGSLITIRADSQLPNETSTDYSTCHSRALSFIMQKPSHLTFQIILWLVVSFVTLSILIFLFIVLRQRIYNAVYYTQNQTAESNKSSKMNKRKFNALRFKSSPFKAKSLNKFIGLNQNEQNDKPATNGHWQKHSSNQLIDAFYEKESTIDMEQQPCLENGDNLMQKRSSVSLLVDSIERKQNSASDLKSEKFSFAQPSVNTKLTSFTQPTSEIKNQQVRFDDEKDESPVLISI